MVRYRTMGALWIIAVLVSGRVALAGGVRPDLWIEQTVEPAEPYIQQQVVVTTTLYRRSSFLTGYFVAGEKEGFRQLFLRESEPESVRIEGTDYERIIYQQALFPQLSGELPLPAVVYSGREVFARSGPRVLRVRPQPAEMGGWWLPAQAAVLTQRWRHRPSTIGVGDILLRTIRLEAAGASGSQLPAFDLPTDPAWTVQRTNARVGTGVVSNRVTGWREEQWRLVPTREGRLPLPALSIPWWDTTADQPREAELPLEWVVVQGGGTPGTMVSAPVSAESEIDRQEIRWLDTVPVVAGALAVLCLVLLLYRQRGGLALWIRRRRLWRGFARACRYDQPTRAWRQLREWYVAMGFTDTPASPLSWARRSDNPTLAAALRELDEALYQPRSEGWSGGNLLAEVTRFHTRLRRSPSRSGRAPVLPTLDPVPSHRAD